MLQLFLRKSYLYSLTFIDLTNQLMKHDVPMLAADWHYPSHTPSFFPTKLNNDDIAGRPEGEEDLDVLLADPELKKPQMYAVVMYNDDYTPMEFVVAVLQDHFKHNLDSAVSIMLAIHHQGKGIAGVYPKDIAETKAQTVNREARQAGFPLLTQIEPMPEG